MNLKGQFTPSESGGESESESEQIKSKTDQRIKGNIKESIRFPFRFQSVWMKFKMWRISIRNWKATFLKFLN